MQDDSKEHTINMGESDRYTQQMQLIDQQVLGVGTLVLVMEEWGWR